VYVFGNFFFIVSSKNDVLLLSESLCFAKPWLICKLISVILCASIQMIVYEMMINLLHHQPLCTKERFFLLLLLMTFFDDMFVNKLIITLFGNVQIRFVINILNVMIY